MTLKLHMTNPNFFNLLKDLILLYSLKEALIFNYNSIVILIQIYESKQQADIKYPIEKIIFLI